MVISPGARLCSWAVFGRFYTASFHIQLVPEVQGELLWKLWRQVDNVQEDVQEDVHETGNTIVYPVFCWHLNLMQAIVDRGATGYPVMSITQDHHLPAQNQFYARFPHRPGEGAGRLRCNSLEGKDISTRGSCEA